MGNIVYLCGMQKKDIKTLTLSQIQSTLVEWGEKKFRAQQIYQWLWKYAVSDFVEMTNLSKALRQKLEDNFEIFTLGTDDQQFSSDGTIKSRFRLFDGQFIETVLIPVVAKNRFTVCVSTQVGCSLSCSFCATGTMDRVRNLEAWEIYDQVVKANQQAQAFFDHPVTNIVYMGMGEPLLNYSQVIRSIEMINAVDGLEMAMKRITLSTAGIAKMIKKLADDTVHVNLALSLHAANDKKRDKIMPINEQNDLESLIDSLDYYYKQTKGNITFEYIALKDFNDSIDDAKDLLRIARRIPAKINIIEYNNVEGLDFTKSDTQKMDDFAAYLVNHGVRASIRRSRGKDIDAACGQLANK